MTRQIYRLLADVFAYPDPALPESVGRLVDLLQGESPQAAAAIGGFHNVLNSSGLTGLQEIYIQAFDFRADCALYIGHHLFGETGKHGVFLAELTERYRERQLPIAEELPDHLSYLLRYLAALEDGEDARELVYACLIPALTRITAVKALAGNPYLPVLQTLPELLENSGNSRPQTGELAWITSSSSPFPMLP